MTETDGFVRLTAEFSVQRQCSGLGFLLSMVIMLEIGRYDSLQVLPAMIEVLLHS